MAGTTLLTTLVCGVCGQLLLLEVAGLFRTNCSSPISFYTILTWKLSAFVAGFCLIALHALVQKTRRRVRAEALSTCAALRDLHWMDVLHNAFVYLLFCYSGVSLTLFRALECENIGGEHLLLVRYSCMRGGLLPCGTLTCIPRCRRMCAFVATRQSGGLRQSSCLCSWACSQLGFQWVC